MLLQHVPQIFRQVLHMTGPTSAVHKSRTALPVPSITKEENFKTLHDKTKIQGFERFQKSGTHTCRKEPDVLKSTKKPASGTK